MRWSSLLLLAGCAGEPSTVVPDDPCATLTWENHGQGFVRSWCSGCHAAALPEGERYGAPVGVSFDTVDEVRRWETRIRARALEAPIDMPPVGGAGDDELARFQAWLDCGAPSATVSP